MRDLHMYEVLIQRHRDESIRFGMGSIDYSREICFGYSKKDIKKQLKSDYIISIKRVEIQSTSINKEELWDMLKCIDLNDQLIELILELLYQFNILRD